MAPYVEREWGAKATELMWRVKQLADPDGVLAPGVVLNRDPGVHLRNLKTTPPIEESATTCVECGFCEPVCPSRNLTTTPRQRIVLRREMARQPEGSPVLAGAAGGVRVRRRSRPAPPTAPASSPARSGSTPASWSRSCAHAAPRRARRKARRCAAARRWGGVEGAARSACGVGGPLARRTQARAGRALPGGVPPRARAAELHPLHDAGPPPSTCPPASTGSSAGSAGRGAGRGLGAGRAAGLDPDGRRRQLLRAALELEGLRRGAPPHGERDGRAALALERRGGAADRRRRQLLHPRLAEPGEGVLERGERRAPRQARDPRLGRLGARPPAALAGGRPQGRLGRRPPDLLDPPPRPRRAPASARRRARRRRLRRRPRPPAAASPATAALPPGADRGRDRAPRPPSSRAATSTPTSPATAPARSASSAPPASPTSRS